MYDARYSHLDDSARYLTCLSLSCCKIECSQDCVFSTSLVELHLDRAQLMRFHDQGVAACSNLRTLSCDDAVVGATNAAYTLNLLSHSCVFPANFSLLTALTTLDLVLDDGECEGQIELSWLTGLTALHQARLSNLPYELVVLPGGISSMCNLRNLSISASWYGNKPGWIECLFDWKSLVSLERVKLSGNLRLFEQFDLSGIMELRNLKVVFIEYVSILTCAHDSYTANKLASFVPLLRLQRPDVFFSTEEDDEDED